MIRYSASGCAATRHAKRALAFYVARARQIHVDDDEATFGRYVLFIAGNRPSPQTLARTPRTRAIMLTPIFPATARHSRISLSSNAQRHSFPPPRLLPPTHIERALAACVFSMMIEFSRARLATPPCRQFCPMPPFSLHMLLPIMARTPLM